MIEKLQNKFDKAFEAAAEKVVGKAVWSQMKQNARQAATGKGGARRIVRALRLLKDKHPGMRLHLAGHSAGSILLGHMLGDMDRTLGVDTVSLFAPACSVDFAVTHYGRALKAGVIGKGRLHVDNLSDENERRDTVGPYGKSLLYLVSRAFEDPYKMPLLGFARSWADAKTELRDLIAERAADFAESEIRAMHKWAAIAHQFGVAHKLLSDREVETYRANGDRVQIKAAHGSFDNDLAVMNAALGRMLGGAAPEHEIMDLRGF
ncbi:MAG: hypothetical protein HC871_04545 [Rhizobiales bacterium]|nr:hypothetical protein [Hyphomicrobiales bacterium]